MKFQDVNNLRVALIHNGDSARLNYLRPKLNNLKVSMSKQIYVNVLEYKFQPPIYNLPKRVPSRFFINLIHNQFIFYINTRKWELYKKNRVSGFMPSLIHQIKILFCPISSFGVRAVQKLMRLGAMRRLTDKHIRAWSDFLDNGKPNEMLLVVEDDLIFKRDSIARFTEISLSFFCNSEISHIPLYLDLAGGLAIDRLRVCNLISDQIKGDIEFVLPVTNTTCAYLINMETAKIFYSAVFANPKLRMLGPDWVINSIFMNNSELFKNSFCKHFDPPVFTHGSFHGHYKTSIGEM